MVKSIVKTVIKTLFVEVVYGIVISMLSIGKSIATTLITQGATTSEISRLNGQTPLVVSETLMKYNNSLQPLATGLIIMFVILGAYTLYKCVKNIIKATKTEASDASDKNN